MTAPFLMCWEYLTRYDEPKVTTIRWNHSPCSPLGGIPHYENAPNTPTLKRLKNIAARFVHLVKRFAAWKRPVVDKRDRGILGKNPLMSIPPFEGIRKHLIVDSRILRRSEARHLPVAGLHHNPGSIRSLRKVHGVVGAPKI